MATTYPAAEALEHPQPASPDGEADFLPAIQSDTRRMGLHTHSRGVPHVPAFSENCTPRTAHELTPSKHVQMSYLSCSSSQENMCGSSISI